MKVRKFLFAGALIAASLFSVNSVMAQATASDNVTVNLKFKPVMSITVDGSDVTLSYDEVADYANGLTTEAIPNHIKIYSTGGFEVKVKAEGNFTRTAGGEIPVGEVLIVATGGTGASDNSEYAEKKSLNTTEGGETLVTKATGGVDINYNVEYDNTAAAKDNKYIDKYIAGDTGSVYSTTVTYFIAAK